jgi:hypothetical protein
MQMISFLTYPGVTKSRAFDEKKKKLDPFLSFEVQQ